MNFVHKVNDAGSHFIFDITVNLNQEQIIEQKTAKQDSTGGGSFVFKIVDAKPGDVIKATVKCNKFGTKSAELKI
ncbi:MAG: hypothetical protein Q7J16_03240 [Candidatus Cloacimonadales bacterium]|nr:hypothetical protein [Candidatus Cloacimonadales bacterium]